MLGEEAGEDSDADGRTAWDEVLRVATNAPRAPLADARLVAALRPLGADELACLRTGTPLAEGGTRMLRIIHRFSTGGAASSTAGFPAVRSAWRHGTDHGQDRPQADRQARCCLGAARLGNRRDYMLCTEPREEA